jgi:protein disulfide-isomerase A6
MCSKKSRKNECLKWFFSNFYLGVTVLCSVVLTEALYGSNSDVVELTAGNFDGKVIQSDDIWLVEFYAPW